MFSHFRPLRFALNNRFVFAIVFFLSLTPCSLPKKSGYPKTTTLSRTPLPRTQTRLLPVALHTSNVGTRASLGVTTALSASPEAAPLHPSLLSARPHSTFSDCCHTTSTPAYSTPLKRKQKHFFQHYRHACMYSLLSILSISGGGATLTLSPSRLPFTLPHAHIHPSTFLLHSIGNADAVTIETPVARSIFLPSHLYFMPIHMPGPFKTNGACRV